MRWSIVLPIYNEQAFMHATLASLAAQREPFRLILVDNASTDNSHALAREIIARYAMNGIVLSEPKPGQVHALERGIAEVDTELVAICDADTYYPPDYLTEAARLLDAGAVAAGACGLPENGGFLRRELSFAHRLGAAQLMSKQNHTGGGCHSFRTEALRAAGAYSARRWPYVLKDHEMMHQVLKRGRVALSRRLWCIPSERRTDRRNVRWTLGERLAYHATPFWLKDWFFHDYLGPRLAARGMADTTLRHHPWDDLVKEDLVLQGSR